MPNAYTPLEQQCTTAVHDYQEMPHVAVHRSKFMFCVPELFWQTVL